MAEKKAPRNKAEKKAPANKAIDWNSIKGNWVVIENPKDGNKTKVGVQTAKILVEKKGYKFIG